MNSQSQINSNVRGRITEVYRYMVLCVSLGIEFSYLKNYQNEVVNIVLDRDKELSLDFARWTSDLQRAVIFENDVQIQINLQGVESLIISTGERMVTGLSNEMKKWMEILYKGEISFSYSPRDLIVKAQRNSEDKEFEFVIRFSKSGEVIEATCKLDGKNYIFCFAESLEWMFYRFLDKAENQDHENNNQVS